MMRYSLIITAVLVTFGFVFVSCSDDDEDYLGNWIELSTFEGTPRTEAVCFTINDDAYIGTGYDIENKDRLNDFFVYDANKDSWTQIADFPGVARNGAVAFASDKKGYCGTGYDGSDKLQDFYEYDPEANVWTQKADFAGTARYGAIAFYANGKGYVGTGYDSGNVAVRDFYQYDSESDVWEKKASVKGTSRRDAMCFVINNEGYVLSGLSNGGYLDDFYKYDADSDEWTALNRLSDYTDDSFDDDYTMARYKGSTFVMGGLAYLTAGIQSSNSVETWEYNPSSDRWTQKTDFEGAGRNGAVGFTVNGQGYIATGGNGSYSFNDLYIFKPYDEYDSAD
ncbi:Kelch repeat-containing protein [Saccharicrinis aurantiacus]|uniref:Kelch repeat-containing protein n=1 Tax=Saccharicrinis aurantiacus TaxID=1849719 RepID=UPI0024911D68|nr:kelch repeat-containing protein [Saccharicrinis aurantiacus]